MDQNHSQSSCSQLQCTSKPSSHKMNLRQNFRVKSLLHQISNTIISVKNLSPNKRISTQTSLPDFGCKATNDFSLNETKSDDGDETSTEAVPCSSPTLDKLDKEYLIKARNQLRKQIATLASLNYAREPQLVRDRNKLTSELEQVKNLQKKINLKYINPFMAMLDKALDITISQLRKFEEQSEQLAQSFLMSYIGYETFIEQYIDIRKKVSIKRILADKLVREKEKIQNLQSNQIKRE